MRKIIVYVFSASIVALGVMGALQYTRQTQPSTISSSQAAPENTNPAIFHAHLQGWYPTEKHELQAKIESCEQQAQTLFDASISAQNIRAIIVPHAGYRYSCDIAASVYRLISPSIKRIMLLAPSHVQAFSGIAMPSFQIYQTPIGQIHIDQAIITQLAEHSPLFFYDNSAYATEHSCEVQLPFIQTYAPHAQVIPLIVGNVSREQLSTAASLLAPYINKDTVLIISSDFTHYGPNFNYIPFTDAIQQRIKQLDSGALHAIQNYDLNAFLTYIKNTGATICGAYPIALLLALVNNTSSNNTLKNVEPRLISYKTSADVTGPSDSSVSYVGMAFATQKTLPQSPQFSQYEKRDLLIMARQILEQSFAKQIPDNLLYPIETHTNSTQQGAFVTLYTKETGTRPKELRGCIGRVLSSDPLYKTIATVTRDAAFKDSRFAPLTIQELPAITISISILTDPRPIASYHDIVLGKHGIILTHQNHSALFLPKVPTEFGWDLSSTLTELSTKAGLSPHAWQEPDTTYQVFESIDFSE